MSIVTVLTPHGRRQTVRCEPNQTCMHILNEICRIYPTFTAADYELIHHRRVLDLTLMFRFAGLPNNAQLEMQAASRQRSVDRDVTLMLQLETGQRVQAEFAPDTTVADIVRQLCPTAIVEGALRPDAVCVYMRTELWGDRLAATTLRALGLTGGRAAIRLTYKDPATLRVQANVSAPLVASTSAVPEPVMKSKENTNWKPTSAESMAPTADKVSADAMDVDETSDALPPKSASPIDRKKPKMNADNQPTASSIPAAVAETTTPSTSAAERTATPSPPPPPPAIIIGPRSAIVYSLDDVQLMMGASGANAPDDDRFYEVNVNDLKVLLRDLRCQAKGQDDAPLLTASMRKLDEAQQTLQRLGKYKRTVIRVHFGAERLVLQGTFGPVDRVADVRDWVRGFVRDEEKEFELCELGRWEVVCGMECS